ncbi:MAG: 4Fe-4S binding protein [Roseburia sp.]
MNKMNLKSLSAKDRKKIHTWVRAIIQLLYFLFLPSAFTAAFSGVKYIFTQIGAGEKVELTSFVTVLLVLGVYTIIFGRFFCGFACAFGSFGDAVHACYLWIFKKWKKKPILLPDFIGRYLSALKYVVLTMIVILCFAGVYGKTKGYSPWDVFSMIHAGNFKLGAYGLGIALLLLLVVGMCVQERFFCRFLCPMGAVFSLLPVLPFFSLRRDRENCINGCSACTRKCPSGIALSPDGEMSMEGECFQCQKCIDTCPKGNVHTGIAGVNGNEVYVTIFKALMLLVLLLWVGI